MKSTLFNMVMVLFVITLLASAGVGAVHMITEEPIAEARVKATREALKQVLPEFDETEDTALTVENLPVTVHTASEGGRVVGYAVESMTKNGFSGVIRLMVGLPLMVRSSISGCSNRRKLRGWVPRWSVRAIRWKRVLSAGIRPK